jgi:hypothetical protein
MAVQAQKRTRTPEASLATSEASLATSEASPAQRLLGQAFRLAGWLLLAAAALAVWPLAIVTAAGYAIAWGRGWPAARLGRQAGWTLPMTAVWIAAESARGWRALTLDPVRDGSSGWPHLTVLTVVRTFLLVAPVTIPAGLALAALVWAWRITAVTTAPPNPAAAQAPAARASAARAPAARAPATRAPAPRPPLALPAPRREPAPGPYPRVPARRPSLDNIPSPGVPR